MSIESTENQRFPKGKHPNSIKNLKPFKPGQSGHPGRTPKDVSLTSLVKKYMEEVPELVGGKKNDKTWRELLVHAWLVGAYKGNSVLFKELLDRLEGKVMQPIGGDKDAPLFPAISVISNNGEKLAREICSGIGTEPLTPGGVNKN